MYTYLCFPDKHKRLEKKLHLETTLEIIIEPVNVMKNEWISCTLWKIHGSKGYGCVSYNLKFSKRSSQSFKER